MIMCCGAPLKIVRLKSHAKKKTPPVPSAYMRSMMAALVEVGTVSLGRRVAIMSRYTGRRAEQLMSGATRIVTSRSRAFSMVRVAMMPGMAHA